MTASGGHVSHTATYDSLVVWLNKQPGVLVLFGTSA